MRRDRVHADSGRARRWLTTEHARCHAQAPEAPSHARGTRQAGAPQPRDIAIVRPPAATKNMPPVTAAAPTAAARRDPRRHGRRRQPPRRRPRSCPKSSQGTSSSTAKIRILRTSPAPSDVRCPIPTCAHASRRRDSGEVQRTRLVPSPTLPVLPLLPRLRRQRLCRFGRRGCHFRPSSRSSRASDARRASRRCLNEHGDVRTYHHHAEEGGGRRDLASCPERRRAPRRRERGRRARKGGSAGWAHPRLPRRRSTIRATCSTRA